MKNEKGLFVNRTVNVLVCVEAGVKEQAGSIYTADEVIAEMKREFDI